jgi:hypothetical protein
LGRHAKCILPFVKRKGKKGYEKKSDFRKVIQDLGYKIENSKKDGNQVHIFNVKVIEENE